MPKSLSYSALTYQQLTAFIKKEIADGKKIITQTQAEKYWNIGKAISDYVLAGADRAKYGRYLVDVFYLPGENDAQKVAVQGVF